ncbi:uncharacterized protein LOC118497796 isoform X2 [Phyllostomus discolor]|uniref:Uncharacterized protein LOC118497796 isoform X2 n=1 Tax=Phyllostomus discolor TaxID=89673 RepID=A0A7E6CQU7_9CHIR|nr:uncharacterized protein LOC118497796 isoform X2 [Phyllostomus discolor]
MVAAQTSHSDPTTWPGTPQGGGDDRCPWTLLRSLPSLLGTLGSPEAGVMWKDRHFSNTSGQGVGGCFKHRHRDVQMLGGSAFLLLPGAAVFPQLSMNTASSPDLPAVCAELGCRTCIFQVLSGCHLKQGKMHWCLMWWVCLQPLQERLRGGLAVVNGSWGRREDGNTCPSRSPVGLTKPTFSERGT